MVPGHMKLVQVLKATTLRLSPDWDFLPAPEALCRIPEAMKLAIWQRHGRLEGGLRNFIGGRLVKDIFGGVDVGGNLGAGKGLSEAIVGLPDGGKRRARSRFGGSAGGHCSSDAALDQHGSVEVEHLAAPGSIRHGHVG